MMVSRLLIVLRPVIAGASGSRLPRARTLPAPSLLAVLLVLPILLAPPAQVAAQEEASLTPARVLEEAPDDAWRPLDPERTLYMTLETGGEVVVELAPAFAPRHVENIRAMVRAGLFDGGAVVRSQDNYVVQWAIRPVSAAQVEEDFPDVSMEVEGEFFFSPDVLPFTPLPDGDVYAPEVGFMAGFAVGRDPARGRAWVLHCYGVVGVARAEAANSGSGASLYAVNGHSPRHLDGNLSMPGRVISGMEHLSVLPRGTEALGFYATDQEQTPIVSARMGSDLPGGRRTDLQVMRTDSPAFLDWIEARRTRVGAWWVHQASGVSACNVSVPTRNPSGA